MNSWEQSYTTDEILEMIRKSRRKRNVESSKCEIQNADISGWDIPENIDFEVECFYQCKHDRNHLSKMQSESRMVQGVQYGEHSDFLCDAGGEFPVDEFPGSGFLRFQFPPYFV